MTVHRFGVQAVDELLYVLDLSPTQRVPVPSWHYQSPAEHKPSSDMPLRDALACCYDLRFAFNQRCACSTKNCAWWK